MFKWWIVSGLIALNVALGIGVFQRLTERSANAQAIGAPRGEIAAVAGNSNGQTVVYLLDVNSGRLIAFRLDVSGKRLGPIQGLNVAQAMSRIP